jgi:putative nucleotidyltransferase with HDIG domain
MEDRELLEAIPEFNEIRDEDLRRRAMAVWKDALERGGFSIEDICRIPFTLLADNVRISFLEHVRTVCRMCMAMADVMRESYGDRVKIDRDVLVAGALLADVGKMIEYEKRPDGSIVKGHKGDMLRHPFSGVGLCFEHGIPYEVMHVVAVHSKEGDHVQRSAEAIVFHHADFTDFEIAKLG